MTNTSTVRNLLAGAEQRLKAIASARLDAEILLANSMNTDRASLYAYPEREVPETVVRHFHLLLNKRLDHYPVAYLTGNKEFWSLELEVDQYTLIPRPETECVIEATLEYVPEQQQCDILDLGTGSGAIALAIASERPACRVVAIDLSQEALAVAASNALKHKIENISFLQSDWFSALKGRQFDLIIANPPYVESDDIGFSAGEIRHEPRLALDGGHHGMQAITHLVPAATHFLKPGARLILEHGFEQAESIRQLFAATHYQDIHSRQDFAGLDRFSLGQWP
jgi:release factor glutamine methyltransferase